MSVKDGLSRKEKIDQKKPRGDTTGQRPEKVKAKKCKGGFKFK